MKYEKNENDLCGKSFYNLDSPEMALKIYEATNNDMYGRMGNNVIEKLLKDIDFKNKNILEIGSGGGKWTRYFIKRGANVTIIEIDKNLCVANELKNPKATFINADATNINIDKKFDFIFVKDVIEHIPEDVKFLKNMNEHLKEGGLIFLKTQNSMCLNYLLEGIPRRIRGDYKWMGWDNTHVRFYTFKSLNTKLSEANYEVIKTFGTYHIPYKILSRKLTGKLHEKEVFHFIEKSFLYDKFPFSVTGWGIGVIAKKRK